MPLTKALIVNVDTSESIPVMFNPPEYQLQKTNTFAEVGIPGLGSSVLQFVKGGTQALSIELFFDTTDSSRDVREFTDKVVALTEINAQTHAPPRLLFVWGSLSFACILESVTQRFDYFDSDGKPLRAKLTTSLKGFEEVRNLLASNPVESADRTKRRVVREGDSLQGLAAVEYNDPRKWRLIAQANNIDNPLTLQVGRGMIIPLLN